MTRFLEALAATAAIALVSPLAGCASAPTPVVATIPADAERAYVAAESGFDAAVVTADLAIRSGSLSPATIAHIRALADIGHACIVAGRAALQAMDSSGLASQTAAIVALVAQLATLSKG